MREIVLTTASVNSKESPSTYPRLHYRGILGTHGFVFGGFVIDSPRFPGV